MSLNFLHIKSAAKNELHRLARTSFSSEGFSSSEEDAIASAIVAAVKAYDEHKTHDEQNLENNTK